MGVESGCRGRHIKQYWWSFHERRDPDAHMEHKILIRIVTPGIKQGPWTKVENNGTAQLRREFTYDIDYYGLLGGLLALVRMRAGLTRPTGTQSKRSVVDYQAVEMQDDHLCYVITDKKTPWHLPHRERFMLVTKIVITHIAKSKCNLAIWTAVEWSNTPAFSKGIIQRQALDDLDLDALDLGDVVTDQVRKLGMGHQGRTKNALRIFGEVGGAAMAPFAAAPEGAGPLASDLEPGAPRLPIKQRRLSRMVAETLLSFCESAASSVIMWTIAGVGKAWEVVSAQRVLVLVLVLSVVANMGLGQRSVVSFWSERRAARWLDQVGVGERGIMGRSVWLRDLEEVVNGSDLVGRRVVGESQWWVFFFGGVLLKEG